MTFDALTKNDPNAVALAATLQSLADGGQIGLVARGIVGGLPRGFVYVKSSGYFQADRLKETVSAGALRASSCAGSTGTARGSTRRGHR